MNVTLIPAEMEALVTTQLAHTSATVLQDSQEQTVKWTLMNVQAHLVAGETVVTRSMLLFVSVPSSTQVHSVSYSFRVTSNWKLSLPVGMEERVSAQSPQIPSHTASARQGSREQLAIYRQHHVKAALA